MPVAPTTDSQPVSIVTEIGTAADIPYSMVMDNGKIYSGGTSNNGTNLDFALMRYNTDGTLDTTFHTDGKVTTNLLVRLPTAEVLSSTPGSPE